MKPQAPSRETALPPCFLRELHVKHFRVHALSQQKPSTQCPLAH